jgi:hypothetical protein
MEDKSAISQARTHTPKLVLTQDVHETIHGGGAIGLINTRIALAVTKSVGSMWCAYLFAALALISLPAAIKSGNSIIIISWVAQTFLQLVLLPIIIVGQNVLAATSDARAQSDHETLISIHTLTSDVHRITLQQSEILEILEKRSSTKAQ